LICGFFLLTLFDVLEDLAGGELACSRSHPDKKLLVVSETEKHGLGGLLAIHNEDSSALDGTDGHGDARRMLEADMLFDEVVEMEEVLVFVGKLVGFDPKDIAVVRRRY
jgi:hypothetical protein